MTAGCLVSDTDFEYKNVYTILGGRCSGKRPLISCMIKVKLSLCLNSTPLKRIGGVEVKFYTL
jgi:hypothetical protein